MPRGARQLRGRRNRAREQRAQNDLRAFVERLLGALLRALRAAAVILDQKLDVGILEFRQRHLGGVLHRLRGDAGIAGGRQRQDQADLDLPGADRERLLLRPGRSGDLRAEPELRLCCTPEQAPSRGAPRIRPTAVRRVAPGSRWIRRSRLAIERAHHRLSSLDRPRSARTSASGPTWRSWIQAYCRRIVNQNKRIMALAAPLPVAGSCLPHRCAAALRTHRTVALAPRPL